MTLAETLAAFLVKADLAAMPSGAREAAVGAIVDGIGVALAGSVTDPARIVFDMVCEERGAPRATLLGRREKTGAPEAALANGTAMHALDYDDIHWSLSGHPTAVVLPAALAGAELRGAPGAALVEAYVLGVEVAGKMGRAMNPAHYRRGWHATGTIGTFGAAAAAAKVLGLGETQAAMAVCLAASHAAGVQRNFGVMAKPLHAGNAARAGLVSALLAARGFTANLSALEAAAGFCDLYGGRPPEAHALAGSLGSPWEVEDPGIYLKRYPACGGTHCALDAVLALREAHAMRPEDVEAVECALDPQAAKILIHARPKTGLEGKFSMEYCLAVALVDGAPGLRHFEEPWVSDPRVRGLLPRITVRPEPALAGPDGQGMPAEVAVHFRSGLAVRQRVDIPSGDPRRPLAPQDRRAKFLDCAGLAVGSAGARTALELLERLPRLPRLDDLLARLCGEGG